MLSVRNKFFWVSAASSNGAGSGTGSLTSKLSLRAIYTSVQLILSIHVQKFFYYVAQKKEDMSRKKARISRKTVGSVVRT